MVKNLTISALLGLLAVLLGAFGAHALKNSLTIDQLQSFETAIRYQMYHVIVLLVVNMYGRFTNQQKNTISYLFFIGIILFSGSIYVIYLVGVSAKSIWFVTPLGGVFLIAGWSLLMVNFMKKKSTLNS